MEAQVRDHDIDLRVDLPGPMTICGEPTRLQQVVVALLTNAIEALAGSARGRILHVEGFAERDEVVLRVVDAGSGLDPEIAARLFEPFQTTRATGLGMGLAISRSIVEAHGGTIVVAPNAPRGTAVTVRLPRASRDA